LGGGAGVEARRVGSLVGRDLGFELERARDVVEPVQERLARILVELERHAQPARVRDLHRLEVDGQLVRVRHRRLQFGERVLAESKKRNSPYPVRSIRFRNCFGMIWSVSTSARSSTATRAVKRTSGFTPALARR